MEEERRQQDWRRDDFMEKLFKLEVAVQRLTEHEAIDRPRYEAWHKELLEHLTILEKLRPETVNGRLKELETRPIIVQISELRIKEIFDERAEVHAGRAFFKLVLWFVGTLGLGIASAFFAYFKLK